MHSKLFAKLRANRTEIALKLHRSCIKIALKLHWKLIANLRANRTEIPVEIEQNCSEIALKSQWKLIEWIAKLRENLENLENLENMKRRWKEQTTFSLCRSAAPCGRRRLLLLLLLLFRFQLICISGAASLCKLVRNSISAAGRHGNAAAASATCATYRQFLAVFNIFRFRISHNKMANFLQRNSCEDPSNQKSITKVQGFLGDF